MQPKHYAYLDALRGYAILGVVATHAVSLVGDRPWLVDAYAGLGASGVQLFFLVSAFTLTKSWHERADGVAPFLVRRFFRIAPAFWLAVPVYLAFPWWARSYWAPHGIHASEVALTLLFLHGWGPEVNAVVPGDWSIANEWGFYVLFPLLMGLRTWRSAALATVIAALAAAAIYQPAFWLLQAIYPQSPLDLLRWLETFWLPASLFTFTAGIGVAHAARELRVPRWAAELEVAAALGLLAALPFIPMPAALPALGPATAFVLLTHGLATGAGRWLVNPVVARIGVVSFSIYLWHFAVITALRRFTAHLPGEHGVTYLALYAVALAITYAISEATYRLVERPMTTLGHRLARRITSTATTRAADAELLSS